MKIPLFLVCFKWIKKNILFICIYLFRKTNNNSYRLEEKFVLETKNEIKWVVFFKIMQIQGVIVRIWTSHFFRIPLLSFTRRQWLNACMLKKFAPQDFYVNEHNIRLNRNAISFQLFNHYEGLLIQCQRKLYYFLNNCSRKLSFSGLNRFSEQLLEDNI